MFGGRLSVKTKTFMPLLLGLGLLFWVSSGDGTAGTLQDIRARGKLTAGVKTDFPPFGFLDNKGVNKGFDIDIAKALSKELFGKGDAVEFVSVTSENRIPFLTSGRVDLVMATMTITEERKKEVDFSTPYFVTGQTMLVRANSKITKYQDLAEKKWLPLGDQQVISPLGKWFPMRSGLNSKPISKRFRP